MTDRSRTLTIVAVLVVAVAAVVVARRERPAATPALPMAIAPVSSHARSNADVPPASEPSGRPRLVDLGAQQCIPCRMMAPVLEELRREYTGTMDVVFIDVWKDPDAGTPYGIDIIPTQIFFDGAGRELYRHQGFIAKADILAMWKQLGYEFGTPSVPPVS
jgi:thioredoxin 1